VQAKVHHHFIQLGSLDELLLNADTIREQYGFGDEPDAPMLLKRHGSLNWFNEKQAAFIKGEKVVSWRRPVRREHGRSLSFGPRGQRRGADTTL
jgi:hypothetical protein